MATTRIISMHVSHGKTIADCLTDRIDYSKNPDKTQGGELISAYECDPKTADAEFLYSKRQYQTVTGREQRHDVIAYQVRQSFKPGEITPEEANRVGYEFAERFLKGRHAFFVATHTDKKHIHNHIIWNSTTLDCKHKFRDFLGSGRAVARLSDAICTEHRLSVIAAPKRGKNHYGKWLGNNAKPSHRELLCGLIDAALLQKPDSFDTLLKLLRDAGCEVRRRGNTLSLRHPDKKGFVRLSSIDGYTEDALRAAGTGFRAIAVTLNEEGVLPPGALYYQRKGRSDPRNVNHKWAETTVKALIRSEVYIGNMVQGKTGTLSYKSRKLINKPEEEWIRVEGTHEPIISREVWDTVVSIDKKKVRKTPPTDGIRSIFTGLVYCADCGFKMRNHIERFTYKDGTPGRYSSFICGNYARSGKSACTIHSIYENVLEELVLTDIREKARFVECDGERLAEQISRMKEKESRSRVISYEQELKAAAARMIELERLMQNLYEDKCTGTIPQTVFQTLMRKYEAERAEKAAAIPELEQKVRAQLENRKDANRWMEVIRRYTEITALDESILFELVDRIEVGEPRKVNGQRICDVKVVYRYVGSVDDALAQERQEAYEKAI